MKTTLFYLLLLISVAANAQDSLQYKVFTPDQAREDIDQYVKLLTETHPGLYRYNTSERFTRMVDSLRASCNTSIPYYELYEKILTITASVKCSHTFTVPTNNFQQFMTSIHGFPFYTHTVGDQVIVLLNGSEDPSILPGFEVLSINGQPIKEISARIRNYMWADGHIELAKNIALQGILFPTFYHMLISRTESYEVTFKTLEGKEITRQLKAVKASVAQRRYKKHSESARILQMYKQQRKKWEVRFPDDLPSTAILVIPGFAGKRINYEEQAQDFVENFMDKALETMKKKGTQNLILELRSNSGGWDIMGTTLISYLLKKQDSISYYGDGYAATNQSEFLKHSDVPEYELKNLSEALEPMPDGSFRLKEQYNATYGMIHKRPNAFKGTIYLLMDEYTGSAAAEFSAIMKSNRLATLVGQETNGTYGGLNGSTFIDLSLPNSNIHVRTPLVRGYLAVDPIQPTARGVLPDYEVAFTLEDILNKRDAQMEKVKSLIRQKGNSTQ